MVAGGGGRTPSRHHEAHSPSPGTCLSCPSTYHRPRLLSSVEGREAEAWEAELGLGLGVPGSPERLTLHTQGASEPGGLGLKSQGHSFYKIKSAYIADVRVQGHGADQSRHSGCHVRLPPRLSPGRQQGPVPPVGFHGPSAWVLLYVT